MSARAFQVAVGRYTGLGVTYIYTCPVGATVLIKSIAVRNGGGSTNELAVGGQSTGSPYVCNWLNRLSGEALPPGASTNQLGMWVLEASDQLWLWSSTAFTFDVWISGTKLT